MSLRSRIRTLQDTLDPDRWGCQAVGAFVAMNGSRFSQGANTVAQYLRDR